MDCKITNSNRRNLNLKPKRLYFNIDMLRFENFDYNRKINSFYALEAVL